ncbi:uncharacterized protein IL334_000777 [Kwoniella shivajii]|uniref:Uncharacterized protein n=1 Tax=Kwoniella shivajii TaxID=564305 RepID=A0ABZ1CUB5_9TREE|nr:hypothetical protein IL334_000777 [Kwoniella shivajii]
MGFKTLLGSLRHAQFQASLLYWHTRDNSEDLPSHLNLLSSIELDGRGWEMALLAYGKDHVIMRTYILAAQAANAGYKASAEDVYMLSPNTPSIDHAKNSIIAYSKDRFKRNTSPMSNDPPSPLSLSGRSSNNGERPRRRTRSPCSDNGPTSTGS